MSQGTIDCPRLTSCLPDRTLSVNGLQALEATPLLDSPSILDTVVTSQSTGQASAARMTFRLEADQAQHLQPPSLCAAPWYWVNAVSTRKLQEILQGMQGSQATLASSPPLFLTRQESSPVQYFGFWSRAQPIVADATERPGDNLLGLVKTPGDNPPGHRAGEDPRRQAVQVKEEKQQVLQLWVILDG